MSDQIVSLHDADVPKVKQYLRSCSRAYHQALVDSENAQRQASQENAQEQFYLASMSSAEFFGPLVGHQQSGQHGTFTTSRAHIPALMLVAQLDALIRNEHTGMMNGMAEDWFKEHTVSLHYQLPTLEPVPEWYKITSPCFQQGRCVCTGDWLGLYVFKRLFASPLCRLCPKDSNERKAIRAGSVVVNFSNNTWWHVAVHCFRPQRPTWFRMNLMDQTLWGRPRVKPVLKDGSLDTLVDMELVDELPIRGVLILTMFNFIVLDVVIEEHWSAGSHLVVDKFTDAAGRPAQFWRGLGVDMKDYKRKLLLRRQHGKRRQAAPPDPHHPKRPRRFIEHKLCCASSVTQLHDNSSDKQNKAGKWRPARTICSMSATTCRRRCRPCL